MGPAKEKTISFFKNQVSFLKEAFIIKDIETFKSFNEAVERYCYYTLEIDKIVDGETNFVAQYEAKENKTLLAVRNGQISIQILSSIFNKNHLFWSDLEAMQQSYYQNTLTEKYKSVQKPKFTIEDFETYAEAKHCLAYIPILGLDSLFESLHDKVLLKKLYKHIFFAMQMNDDLEDFTKDITNNQWTYLHAAVDAFMIQENIEIVENISKFKERVLYVSGIGIEAIKYTKNHFNEALELSIKLELTKITEWLKKTIEEIKQNERLVLSLLK